MNVAAGRRRAEWEERQWRVRWRACVSWSSLATLLWMSRCRAAGVAVPSTALALSLT